MDEIRSDDMEKQDEVMLPGFRFHPTDEELVSTRPNRVTGAGFWKATGTDRPIYSSDGSKCIGLKKSLVFYKGRAAKGVKTDWMMHEFRLPSLADPSLPQKKPLEKTIPPNFTGSSYMSSIVHSSSHNPLSVIDSSSRPAASIAFPPSSADHQNLSVLSAIPLDLPAGMDIASMVLNATPISLQNMGRIPANIEFSQPQHCNSNSSSSLVNRCTIDLPDVGSSVNGAPRSINFPFNMQTVLPDDWRMTLPWDSLPCTTEVLTSYQSTKCYT
ncbi:hypothetical protein PR202_ga02726 [Eleusine coracana subsp. coracana]|uniref:NAC domain-containing protein n=1 Tax=Eleusine coracana subsp. coracana TaxID=191504 RepID=A0AAV5BLJ8_ELECO|nr:hypothetical protein PR202_ga02726 [Eleusine coracana subsp. coracana]